VEACIEKIGIGFMFAPNHHSAMKHVAPVRRELGVRTMFNLLGPLTNPANTKNQVIGVFMRELTSRFAVVLQQLGSFRALVVHGADGMDEISITAPTFVAELKSNHIEEYTVGPEDFGLRTATLDDIRVADADQAKNMLISVMNNQASAARDITVLNAAAGIYIAGLANSLAEGVGKATETIASNAARNKLVQLIEITNLL
jgi:anthranilate phosphoribosyltransferase